MPVIADAEQFPLPEDPASVSPTSSDSPPSSTAPEDMDESTTGTGEVEYGVEDEPEVLPEFDERSKKDFLGLLYLGALTHQFTFAGHSFMIRTLTTDEILATGQVIEPYQGTQGEMKAYATAVVAAAVTSVDGQPLKIPYKDEPGSATLQARFDEVKQWYPYTIDFIYSQFLILEDKMNKVFAEMGKASG